MELQQDPGLIEVPAANLEAGMYVAGLDRPWLDTPFAVQGFYVMSRDDVEFVAEHCAYVYVDPRRRSTGTNKAAAARPRRTYRNRTTLKQELKTAKADLTSASETMGEVFRKLKSGGHLNIKVVQSAISPLIQSVLRNSEAVAALMRMKSKGEYLYGHSIAVAVWAGILGRHLGLARDQLEQLALGGALIDVGMASVDDSLTAAPNKLTAGALQQIHSHVPLGVALLKASGELPKAVLDMVATHHERHDGSGYPQGLAGMEIPMFGRIAGLVDSYDAMITSRPYAESRSSFEAMQELADLKDRLFQGALVEQFMQAIGLFPTGSVVQLNTDEIGVVLKQNPTRRLRPKVAVILDRDGRRHSSLVIIDLAKYERDGTVADLWITRELEPGSHGIHPGEFFL